MTNSTLEIAKVVLIVDNSGDHSSSKEKLYDVGIIRAFYSTLQTKINLSSSKIDSF